MAPKMLTTRSKESSSDPARFEASPSWNRQLVRPVVLGPPVAGLDQVAGDVDAQHSAPSLAAGNAVVPSPQPRSSTFMPGVIPSSFDQRLAALAHGCRDAGEVALLPERLVRIHRITAFPLDKHPSRSVVSRVPPSGPFGSLHQWRTCAGASGFFESWCASELAHAVQSSEVPGVAIRVRMSAIVCRLGATSARRQAWGCRLANGLLHKPSRHPVDRPRKGVFILLLSAHRCGAQRPTRLRASGLCGCSALSGERLTVGPASTVTTQRACAGWRLAVEVSRPLRS